MKPKDVTKQQEAIKKLIEEIIKDNGKLEDITNKAYAYLQDAFAIMQTENPFYATILTGLETKMSLSCPTAGVTVNPELMNYELYVNPIFFGVILKDYKQRVAILTHEIMHLSHGHLTRVPCMLFSKEQNTLLNVAGDISINQYIQNLPQDLGLMTPEMFKYKDAQTGGYKIFPKDASMDLYYKLLLQNNTQVKIEMEGKSGESKKGSGEGGESNEESGDGSEKGDGKQCQGKGSGNKSHKWISVKEWLEKHGYSFDDHSGWEKAENVDEGELLKKTEELIERSRQKNNLSYDNLPGSIKDHLHYSEKRKKELNYKAILLKALKKSLAGLDRQSTWTRPNKRYGYYAPGTKDGNVPSLHMFIDTSGSISVEEINEFLGVIKEFIRISGNACTITKFHTDIYGTQKFTRNSMIKQGDLQSGGTELTPVLEHILKTQPELSIVLTDGCYGDVPIERKMNRGQKFPTTVFMISKGGDMKHPLKRLGETIKIPGEKKDQ